MKELIVGGIVGLAINKMIGNGSMAKVVTASLASGVITYFLIRSKDKQNAVKN